MQCFVGRNTTKAPFEIIDLSGAKGKEARHPKVEAYEVIQLTIVHCIIEAELISLSLLFCYQSANSESKCEFTPK